MTGRAGCTWCGRAAEPATGPAVASAQSMFLHGQQTHSQRVREQHHAQRDVEADDRADQLVERVRDLTHAVHQH